MPTIAEVQEMKSKALKQIIMGLDTENKQQKLDMIKLLGNTVAVGVKVDTEQEAVKALEKEAQSKSLRVRNAAKRALNNIRNTQRVSSNPLDMFAGGVGFSSKK